MNEEAFGRYDTADYLKNDEDIVAYMEAAAEEAGWALERISRDFHDRILGGSASRPILFLVQYEC